MEHTVRSLILLYCLLVLAAPARADSPTPDSVGSAAQQAYKPGDVFYDCPHCPELVVVPAGVFIMGQAGGKPTDGPPHRVNIAKPFAIGRYEVTFEQWDACLAAGACEKDPHDHNWGRGAMPVINIGFADAEQYLRWLSAETGQVYRLPSEAEWEYAARAGTVSLYWWGDEVGENHANCRKCGSPWSGVGSAPVGSFAPNPWGLYDTAGNVWEWTADCWFDNHDGAPNDGTARRGPSCADRVVRSGSWYYFPRLSQSAHRARNRAEVYSYNIGLRVLRELP